MTSLLKLCKLGVLLAFTGWSCVAAANGNEVNGQESHRIYPTMAIPLQPSLQNEVNIAKLNQILLREDLDQASRARAYYERGRYYDNLGLRDLARLDFNQSLSINPRQPLIFNRLGVYFTHVGEFDAAYDAFDSTLDLDPTNQDALRNRAVALYYGNRTALAHEDMLAHFNNDPSDPFRALWLFIIECELNEEAALKSLAARYENRTDNWNWVLVGIMLGEVEEEAVLELAVNGTNNNTMMAQRLTEAYFYMAKHFKTQGKFGKAMTMYKLAISLNVYDYVEHGYAFLELGKLYREYKAASKAGKPNKFVNVN